MTVTPPGTPGAVTVDLAGVLRTMDQPWQPRTVATLNDYDVRVVRTAGEFTPHSHPETDELFLVLSGSLTIVVERPEGPDRVELPAAERDGALGALSRSARESRVPQIPHPKIHRGSVGETAKNPLWIMHGSAVDHGSRRLPSGPALTATTADPHLLTTSAAAYSRAGSSTARRW